MADFFNVVGGFHNLFLIFGIVAALGLAVWMTFFPTNLSPASIERWIHRLVASLERWIQPLVVSIERWGRPWVEAIVRRIRPRPLRSNRDKPRKQRAGKKRAGAKRRAPSE